MKILFMVDDSSIVWSAGKSEDGVGWADSMFSIRVVSCVNFSSFCLISSSSFISSASCCSFLVAVYFMS